MRTSSAKAKGRRLQDALREGLREIGKEHGLEADDIKSQIMGVPGCDIVMSPAAKAVFNDLKCECKNREQLNVVSTFLTHAAKYNNKNAILVHKRNHTPPLVTMFLTDYLELLGKSVVHRA
jgi:hypothetical protein